VPVLPLVRLVLALPLVRLVLALPLVRLLQLVLLESMSWT
jgi:hypothetical protein